VHSIAVDSKGNLYTTVTSKDENKKARARGLFYLSAARAGFAL
jgi:hypothetical protein